MKICHSEINIRYNGVLYGYWLFCASRRGELLLKDWRAVMHPPHAQGRAAVADRGSSIMPHRVVASEELTLMVDMARTQESVFAVDAACRIVFLNEHAEALLGYRASDVIGCRCCDALHFANQPGSPICGLCIRALATPESQPSSSRF